MEKGRFGIHGGQYIPETLMNEIIHLEEQYEFYKNDPEFCAELDDLLKKLCRKTVAVILCGENDKGSGRCEDLFKAGGLKPHRLSQDQQRTRSGADGKKDG